MLLNNIIKILPDIHNNYEKTKKIDIQVGHWIGFIFSGALRLGAGMVSERLARMSDDAEPEDAFSRWEKACGPEEDKTKPGPFQ